MNSVSSFVNLKFGIKYQQLSEAKEIITSTMRPGGMKQSIISLVAVTMGAGTLTIPFIIALNGIALGSLYIILGAVLSYYSGMLLVSLLQFI